MALTQPTFLPGIFAASGTHENIPDTTAGISEPGRVSWDVGFPSETSLPLDSGGIPPRRADMNGIDYKLSSHIFFQQSGSLYSWSNTLPYLAGAHVLGSDGQEYVATANSGPDETIGAVDPTTDVAFSAWKPLARLLVDVIYPVGSIYMSVLNVNPALLFGGTWDPISGRFLLAAGGNYNLGDANGGSKVTLKIENLPAHNHIAETASAGSHNHSATTASNGNHTHNTSGTAASGGSHSHTATTASAGAHTHGITVTNGAQSAGAHTHGVTYAAQSISINTGNAGAHTHDVSFPKTSYTTSTAGAHTHTRGTMNITGTFNANQLYDHNFSGETADGHQPVATGAFKVGGAASKQTPNTNADSHQEGFSFDASQSWTGKTSEAGGHTHTVSVSASLTAASAGAHAHSVSFTIPAQNMTAGSAGAHTHNLSGTTGSAGAHTHTITVANGGAHTHTVSGTAAQAGAHTHAVTVNDNGAHTHLVTVKNTGSNVAFDIMPPYLAVNIWKRIA